MDKAAMKKVGPPKGREYCDKPYTSCWYGLKDFCVNCGRPKGWRKLPKGQRPAGFFEG